MNNRLTIGKTYLYKGYEVVRILNFHGSLATVQAIDTNLSWYALHESLFELSPVLKELYEQGNSHDN